ncbi:MAG: rRNA maturation RNase YbeY [Chlamydiales bacterium]|nr:rRNA maturation RNase YbeY [Chlamydiales bacterium]
MIDCTIYNKQRSLRISKTSAKASVLATLDFLGLSCDEISVHFVSEKEISALHLHYFDDPTPTDTISFPIDAPGERTISTCHLGEVFICPAVAIKYAKKNGLDPYQETTLYLVHGILHLIGFDDLTPEEKKEMRAQERRCMKSLQQKNALLKPE